MQVETSLAAPITRGVTITEQFKEGDILGLYVAKEGTDELYNSEKLKNLAHYQNGQWTCDAYLEHDRANVYAYYPADIEVVYNKPSFKFYLDHFFPYLYGTHAVGSPESVNNVNPSVKLQMKHLRGIIEFYFRKSDYTGVGKVTEINLINNPKASTHCVPYRAEFNYITKTITDPIYNTIAYSASNSDTGLVKNMGSNFPNKGYQIFGLTTQPSSKEGDIQFRFIIDGKTYEWNLPAGTEWKGGYKYTYYVTLSSGQLKFDEVTIDKYEDEKSENINL